MTSHICSRCGETTDCPNRNIGTGRQTPLTRYGANHSAVLSILQSQPSKNWTVRMLQGELGYLKVPHRGKRDAWNYVAVQAVVSDLVGWEYATMQKVPRSREWMYRFVRPHIAIEVINHMVSSAGGVEVVSTSPTGKTDLSEFFV